MNFYNFRKVNRERNFWVYKHPLFQRERPQDLHLLRRRTCPGVDGRKVRPDVTIGVYSKPANITPNVFSPPAMDVSKKIATVSPHESSSDSDSDDRKRKVVATRKKSEEDLKAVLSKSPFSTEETPAKKQRTASIEEDFVPSVDRYMRGPSRLAFSPLAQTPVASVSDMNAQSALVSKVSKQLEEHAKNAAGRFAMKKRAGTPSYISDSMRYNGLTYDDEVEIYDSARGCVVERNTRKPIQDDTVSEDGSENSATVVSFTECEVPKIINTTAPITDAEAIDTVIDKLRQFDDYRFSEMTVAVVKFCMTTNPHDPSISEKAIELMTSHEELAHEFCRYKIALSPSTCNHEQFMKDLFSGKSKDTVRGFKTFVLNTLKDVVRDSNCSEWSESSVLTDCYNIWFSGLTLSV